MLAAAGATPLHIVGVHGVMHGLVEEAIIQVSSHLGHVASGAQLCLVGDWNVDMKRTFSDVPASLGSESSSVSVARDLLNPFADKWKLDISLPTEILSLPGGPWCLECALLPPTRAPSRELSDIHVPSLLGFALVTRGETSKAFADWEFRPADHAIFPTSVEWLHSGPLKNSTHRRCSDEQAALRWLQDSEVAGLLSHNFAVPYGLSDFRALCINVQNAWRCTTTCAVRITERLPT